MTEPLGQAFLSAEDVLKFDDDLDTATVEDMIETVYADAVLVAPCIKDEDFVIPEYRVKVKSILRGVVLRWADAGSGGVKQRAAGDFSESLDLSSSGGKLRPGEIRELQDLCVAADGEKRRARATTIPTGFYGPMIVQHAEWCSMSFGGNFCDCGAILSGDGQPLWNRTLP